MEPQANYFLMTVVRPLFVAACVFYASSSSRTSSLTVMMCQQLVVHDNTAHHSSEGHCNIIYIYASKFVCYSGGNFTTTTSTSTEDAKALICE